MKRELPNAEYWQSLRAEIDISGTGRALCEVWCNKALPKLQAESNYSFKKKTATRGYPLVRAGLSFHSWLEAKVDGKRFVADGTAGQLEQSCSEGYYGFLHAAPATLQEIYLNPQ